MRASADPDGRHVGFGGRTYRTRADRQQAYDDAFDDYLGFLRPHLVEARRLLSDRGTLYVHLDCAGGPLREGRPRRDLRPRGVPQRDRLGLRLRRRSRRRWPAKHDTILVYVRDPDGYHFDAQAVDREPYMAPGPGDAREGRAGQAADRRVVAHDRADQLPTSAPGTPPRSPRASCGGWSAASTAPGDWCLDFFCGSGTLGAVAAALGRRYVLVDRNPAAIQIARDRLTMNHNRGNRSRKLQ